ncbi:hypothetical protein DFJ58DRAFT_272189 [Suillus subalutaceus]|uniref:uncharacterized protein n=1 Tax=Suillus subalutaceus TaxID=48586 RepID=UPI001B868662|nr:uncharacterized protein DFJ58DRAFT_272189 [Suillus subalutaceus]KAG1860745.1 hypothetical protein DFJ58DRAFT_272189 [Suillus subalutaceus]
MKGLSDRSRAISSTFVLHRFIIYAPSIDCSPGTRLPNMPAIRRGSTYLDVSTTAHTPEGRLKLDKLGASRKLAQQNAVCTALLFICDENRNLGPADTLSVSFEEFKTTMKSRASAADLKLGPCQHTYLRRVLLFFWEHGHIDLTFAHNGRQRDVVQQIEIQPSFYDMQVLVYN